MSKHDVLDSFTFYEKKKKKCVFRVSLSLNTPLFVAKKKRFLSFSGRIEDDAPLFREMIDCMNNKYTIKKRFFQNSKKILRDDVVWTKFSRSRASSCSKSEYYGHDVECIE